MRFWLFCAFFPVFAFGQHQFRFRQLNIKNGLSQNTVNCVLKDSKGFYWIGTQDGLNRWDGYRFKTFRFDRSDTNSLSDNFILTIIEDRDSNLWIGTRNGLCVMDPNTYAFRRIYADPEERKEYHNSVWNVVSLEDGSVLYSSQNGKVVRVNYSPHALSALKIEIISNKGVVTSCQNGGFFVSEKSGLFKAYAGNMKRAISTIDLGKDLKRVILCRVNEQDYIVKGPDSLMLINIKTANTKCLLTNVRVNKAMLDSKKNLWVGTSNGLYFFKNCDFANQPLLLKHKSNDSYSLGSSSIQSLYEDPRGLIWVGNAEGGVSVYDPITDRIKIFNHSTGISLPGNSAWSIFQDGPELWVGTGAGLIRFRMTNDKASKLYSEENKIVESHEFLSEELPDDFISSILKDRMGRMWIGTHKGVSVLDRASGTWQHYDEKNSSLASNVVFHQLLASDGRIWISTQSGVSIYDPSTSSFTKLRLGYSFYIFEDFDSTYWVGTTTGAYHLNRSGSVINRFKTIPENTTSLSYNMVTSFLRDSKGRLWMSTLGGGLNLFNDSSEKFQAFQFVDGLANDICYAVLEDNEQKLWISTNSGLSKFDPDSKSFVNFTEEDGLPANEFVQNAAFKNDRGEMFFGTPEGLILFDPAAIVPDTQAPKAIISRLMINFKDINLVSDHLELHHQDKAIFFDFAAPDFRNQHKVEYAYMLEGFDTEWNHVPSDLRNVSLTNLPYGTFNFKVRTRLAGGTWNDKAFSIPVSVIPPFWSTDWFILLEFILGLLVISLVVRYFSQRKLRSKLREIEVQQKIHSERERISRDLHDNVGSHLTYLITSLDGLNRKKPELNVMKHELEGLTDFSRSTMHQLRESIWAIQQDSISLEELKNKIREYGYKMGGAANMKFVLREEAISNIEMPPSLAMNIYRVVQEAVNNAIKHSGGSELVVGVIQKEDSMLEIEVADNGMGIKEDLAQAGFGMKNMKDRVNDLGGDFTAHSDPEHGTRVRFNVPMN